VDRPSDAKRLSIGNRRNIRRVTFIFRLSIHAYNEKRAATPVAHTAGARKEVLMEAFDSVRTVLAVRSFQDKALPEDAVKKIVEAARLTASARNSQPWHFIVVEDRGMLKQLGAVAPNGHYIAQAALAVVVAIEKSPYAVSDASRAIQSMILTAWSAGIGSNWVGFMGLDSVRALLGIPDTLDVLAIVPFGYPTEQKDRGKKNRKTPAEIAHRERFGQPFS
jgi:nitroreductase